MAAEGVEGKRWSGKVSALARGIRSQPAIAVVVAYCGWRFIWFFLDVVGGVLSPTQWPPDLHWMHKPALAILSLSCAVAALRGRRSALVWAGWALLVELIPLGGARFVEAPHVVWPLVAWSVVIALLVRSLPPGALSAPSRWRDLRVGLLATLGLFVALEGLAGVAIRNFVQQILDPPDPVVLPPPQFVPGLPTFVTLGSSPATVERVHDRPFSRVLAERYQGRLNFLYHGGGGFASHRLLRVARETLESGERPDGLILYVGHQDYNSSRGEAFLQNIDIIGRDERLVSAVRWLVRQSCLVRLSLYLLWERRYGHLADRGPEWRQEVFNNYSKNMDQIIELAGRHGVHVFAVTVQADRRMISPESLAYMNMENKYIRELPGRFNHVTLVDFEPVLDALYPAGPRPDCEPYEPNPITGGCGDPYHLGPKGHEILADLLGPILERWVETRRAGAGAE